MCILAFSQHFNKFFFVTYKPLLASAVLKSLAKFTLLIKKGWMSNASSLSYEKGISLNENLICIVIFYDLLEFWWLWKGPGYASCVVSVALALF